MEPGRPPIYDSPENLQYKVTDYFTQFRDGATEKPMFGEMRPTITGLCLFCGFDSRQSFYDYEKREGFSYTIKKARVLIENVYEQMLGGKNPAGAIFALKNFDWSDKQEIDHTSGGDKIQGFVLNVKPDTK